MDFKTESIHQIEQDFKGMCYDYCSSQNRIDKYAQANLLHCMKNRIREKAEQYSIPEFEFLMFRLVPGIGSVVDDCYGMTILNRKITKGELLRVQQAAADFERWLCEVLINTILLAA